MRAPDLNPRPPRRHATALGGAGTLWRPERVSTIPALIALGAAALSIAIGASVGNPTPLGVIVLGVILGLAIESCLAFRPWAAFLIVACSNFFLICWAINDNQYLNLFDFIMPILFTLSAWGGLRARALEERARLTGPAHAAILGVTRQLAHGSAAFYAVMILSLVTLLIHCGKAAAIEVALMDVRTMYGVLMFPLALWWLRTERRIDQTIMAVAVATVGLLLINLQKISIGDPRAGMTWVVNHPEWGVEDPNELGAGLSVICAMILARQRVRPAWWTYPAVGIALWILTLTESRSGTLCLLVFLALSIRSFRWRQLLIVALLMGAALLILPEGFRHKIHGTLTYQRGNFEVYTIGIRIYSFHIAWRVFLDNWLFGVGYLGLRYVSHNYNELAIRYLGAENFFLETAAGVGVIGLSLLAFVYYKLFQLGRTIERLTPPGTLGNSLARLHLPLLAGVSIASLTGDNLIGFIGVGQVALWCAMLIRAGHLAVDRGASGEDRSPAPAHPPIPGFGVSRAMP